MSEARVGRWRRKAEEPGVSCASIDSLTDLVTVDGGLSRERLELLGTELTARLEVGTAFVVVDLRRAEAGAAGLAPLLAAVARRLGARSGGLAVVGGLTVFPDLAGKVTDGTLELFSDPPEALARVRGRLRPGGTVRATGRLSLKLPVDGPAEPLPAAAPATATDAPPEALPAGRSAASELQRPRGRRGLRPSRVRERGVTRTGG
jgi:hypothetical protein